MSDAYERPTGERLVGLLYGQRRWATQPIAAFVFAAAPSRAECPAEESTGGRNGATKRR